MTAVDFRCERCGKLLSVESQPGVQVECPHCGQNVTVPIGLASLPHPHVPPNAHKKDAPAPQNSSAPQASSQQTTPPPAAPATEASPESEEPAEASAALGLMATLMPWILSLFLHVGVGLVLAFVGMMVIQQVKTETQSEVFVNGDTFGEKPGGVIDPGDPGVSPENHQNVKKNAEVTGSFHHESTIIGATGGPGNTTALIGVGGGGGVAGGGMAKFGIGSGGSGKHGPKASFSGSGGNAHHVVYVIDRSGSMIMEGAMDKVKNRMRISIGNLSEVQDFHVIFFGKDTTVENPPKRLVPATPQYKGAAAEYLETVVPSGTTDPIPSLGRAFDVLKNADPKFKGKLIFLLTDGDFKNVGGNKAVIDFIADRNKDKTVHVNTYLYGSAIGGNKSIIDTMKQIADSNGGEFKVIAE